MSDESAVFDQLALDVANRKLTLAGAFRVAYLKGYGRGLDEPEPIILKWCGICDKGGHTSDEHPE